MDPVSLIIGIITLCIVLFVPGYAITLALFPNRKEIDDIERVTLSFAFSIAVVPLVLVLENFVGIPVNVVSSLGTTILVTVAALAYFFKKEPKAWERVREGDLYALLLMEAPKQKPSPKRKGKK
jgi:uncharacterized membrane protein